MEGKIRVKGREGEGKGKGGVGGEVGCQIRICIYKKYLHIISFFIFKYLSISQNYTLYIELMYQETQLINQG